MLIGAALLALALAPSAAPAQALRNAPARRELQARVFERFMDRASERLRLDAAQRRRLEDVLRQNEGRRRALAREGMELRRQLARVADDPDASDSELKGLLDRMAELRRRDLQLWQQEQRSLAAVLSPRQRAQFLALRLQFTETVQRMRRERLRRSPQAPRP